MLPPFKHYDPDDPDCAAFELDSASGDEKTTVNIRRKRRRAPSNENYEQQEQKLALPVYNVEDDLDINQGVEVSHDSGFKFDFEDGEGPEDQEFVVEDEPDDVMVVNPRPTKNSANQKEHSKDEESADAAIGLFSPDDIKAGFDWVDARSTDPAQVCR